MLLYEHDRTKEIVNHLVKSSKIVRTVIILFLMVVMAVLFGQLAFLMNGDSIIRAASEFIGLLFGAVLGFLVSSVVNVVLEWMAQLLIAQGETLSVLRKKNKA